MEPPAADASLVAAMAMVHEGQRTNIALKHAYHELATAVDAVKQTATAEREQRRELERQHAHDLDAFTALLAAQSARLDELAHRRFTQAQLELVGLNADRACREKCDAEIEELRATLSSQSAALATSEQRAALLEAELAHTRQRFATELPLALQSRDDEIQQLKSSLVSTRAECETQLTEANRRAETDAHRVLALESRCTSLAQELTESSARHEADTAALASQLVTLRIERDDCADLAARSDKLAAIAHRQCDTMQARVAQLEAETLALQSAVKSAGDNVDSLRAQLRSRESEVSRLISTHERECAKLREGADTKDREIQHLAATNERARQMSSEVVDANQKALQAKVSELETLTASFESLQSELTDTRSQLELALASATSHAEIDRLRHAIAESRARVDSLTCAVRTAESERDAAMASLSKSERWKASLETEMVALHGEFAAVSEQHARVEADRRAAGAARDQLVRQFQAERVILLTRIAQCELEIEHRSGATGTARYHHHDSAGPTAVAV